MINKNRLKGFFIGFIIVCMICSSYNLGVKHTNLKCDYKLKVLSDQYTGNHANEYINGVHYSNISGNKTINGYLLINDYLAFSYHNKFISQLQNLYLFGVPGEELE